MRTQRTIPGKQPIVKVTVELINKNKAKAKCKKMFEKFHYWPLAKFLIEGKISIYFDDIAVHPCQFLTA